MHALFDSSLKCRFYGGRDGHQNNFSDLHWMDANQNRASSTMTLGFYFSFHAAWDNHL